MLRQESINQIHVVIVGAGYAGTCAAQLLDKANCRVTLVEQTDAFHNKVAVLRAMVFPGWENHIRVPIQNVVSEANGSCIVQGEVVAVEPHKVTLKDGSSISCDFIILAHGNGQTQFPINVELDALDSENFKRKMQAIQVKIRDADDILIIGGGPVGVELTGEILAYYPSKRITIVQRGHSLLSNCIPPIYPEAIQKISDTLTSLGVRIITDTQVLNISNESADIFMEGTKTFELSDGTTINTDLAINCTGHYVQCNFLSQEYLEGNKVCVNEYLEVENLPKVFCIGDATNIKETKLGYYANKHAAIAVKNILRLAKGNRKLRKYKPVEETTSFGEIVIPLGPDKGIAVIGTMILGDFTVNAVRDDGIAAHHLFRNSPSHVPSLSMPLPACSCPSLSSSPSDSIDLSAAECTTETPEF